jgi:hypothetical protein
MEDEDEDEDAPEEFSDAAVKELTALLLKLPEVVASALEVDGGRFVGVRFADQSKPAFKGAAKWAAILRRLPRLMMTWRQWLGLDEPLDA